MLVICLPFSHTLYPPYCMSYLDETGDGALNRWQLLGGSLVAVVFLVLPIQTVIPTVDHGLSPDWSVEGIETPLLLDPPQSSPGDEPTFYEIAEKSGGKADTPDRLNLRQT